MDFMHLYRQPSRLYILLLNIATMLASISLFGLGIHGLASESSVLLASNMLSWTLIVLSLVTFLVSLLGCAGALGCYKNVLATVEGALDQAWQNAFDNHPKTLQDLEIRLHCCGFEDVTDRAVPKNCRYSPAFGYETSCKAQLRESYMHHENMVITAITIVEALQILALVATMVLWSKLPRGDELDEQYRTEHSRSLLRGLQEDDRRQAATQGYGTIGDTL
ncbi:hypothetical protein BGZ94_008325 [Podila epigama]|nr:hypothetical protein BGZ94_008325 [Podila epigama]